MITIAALSLGLGLLQTDELPRKPMLGIQFQPNSLAVAGTAPGGSAEGALKTGDVIVEFDKKAVKAPGEVTTALTKMRTGQKVDVTVQRDGKPLKIAMTLKERPREVSADYDVIYGHVMSNGKRIRTIITRPKAEGKYPVFFMMQGLGQFSMDFPLSGTTGPYREFLAHFAKQKFVTIRVEKPGMGDAEGGPYPDTDFYTEGDVYLQALRDVKKKPYVNPDRVFLFGHSMGGTFGPWVVSQEPVYGFIPSSTLYKTWTEYWLENVRRQNVLAGASPTDVDQQARADAVIQPLVLLHGWSPAQVAEKFPEYKASIDGYFAADPTKMMGRTLEFWRQLAKLNLPELWTKVKCNTLVLWGEYDFVSTEADHLMIRDQLNAQNPGSATYARIPNSFHGFTQASSYENAFRVQGQAFNNRVIEVMDEWIKKQLGD
ncbi:MAG: alpha/beta fold hydrolase [Chthonomonas sp.]|nr:alpha/beta fold hydrolase [Chthonomonas sp.]